MVRPARFVPILLLATLAAPVARATVVSVVPDSASPQARYAARRLAEDLMARLLEGF